MLSILFKRFFSILIKENLYLKNIFLVFPCAAYSFVAGNTAFICKWLPQIQA